MTKTQTIWKENYIKEYSKLFFIKTELLNENDRLNSIIQHQIEKSKCDAKTHTDEMTALKEEILRINEISESRKAHIELLEAKLNVQAPSNSKVSPSQDNVEDGALQVTHSDVVVPMIEAKPSKPKEHVCVCGYNASNKKNRLKIHQMEHCPMIQKTARTDYRI